MAILLLLAAAPAQALTCNEIRAYIAANGEAAAIREARARGYSEAEIARIRARCVPGTRTENR